MNNTTITVENQNYQIKSDYPRIRVDGWKLEWATLNPGDVYIDESYRGSQYVIQDEIRTARMPVNIHLTGRKIQTHIASDRSPFMRCEIEFVQDGEPSTFTRGYVEMEWTGEIFE